MKIAIVSAIWQRESLTRIFLNSVKRYSQDYGISTMIAGSEGKRSQEMCRDYGAGYVEAPNSPLSAKFNKAATMAIVSYKPDALMILGSDDFVNDTLIHRYFICLEQGYDIVGFRDCYFYHTGSKETAYWRGYQDFRKGMTIGMARMVSRKTWELLRGKLWPSNMDSGLDYNMTKKINKLGKKVTRHSFSVNDDNYVLVDVKGQGGMSEFGCYRKDMHILDNGVFNTIPEFSEIEKL